MKRPILLGAAAVSHFCRHVRALGSCSLDAFLVQRGLEPCGGQRL
jgi:hypothetical protein